MAGRRSFQLVALPVRAGERRTAVLGSYKGYWKILRLICNARSHGVGFGGLYREVSACHRDVPWCPVHHNLEKWHGQSTSYAASIMLVLDNKTCRLKAPAILRSVFTWVSSAKDRLGLEPLNATEL